MFPPDPSLYLVWSNDKLDVYTAVVPSNGYERTFDIQGTNRGSKLKAN